MAYVSPDPASATDSDSQQIIAFAGCRKVAEGGIDNVAAAVKGALDRGEQKAVLIFDARTSEPVEIDFRGSLAEVLRRVPHHPDPGGHVNADVDRLGPHTEPRGPGRPRLGVVAREVTLLPRHWDWLAGQPGGASAVIRRLVDDARKRAGARDRLRATQESAYRFMLAMAGNEPGFEEATRALFAGHADRFGAHTATWPPDIRQHACRLAEAAWTALNDVERDKTGERT